MDTALEIWSHIKQYVEAVKIGKVPIPKCKSFYTIAGCCGDELFVVKGNIFSCIAKDLLPFLTNYQTDKLAAQKHLVCRAACAESAYQPYADGYH